MEDHDYIKKPVANKRRNTNYCCVPQCLTYRGPGISLHLFPKDENKKRQWQTALRMGKPVSSAMRVCSRHFQASDFFPNSSKNHKLFPHVVPSQNIPKRTCDIDVPVKLKQLFEKTGQKLDTRTVASKEDVMEDEENVIEDTIQNKTFVSSSHHVISASTQANLIDFRKNIDRPQGDRSVADSLCEKEPLEKCTQVNWLPTWEEERSAVKQLTLSDPLSSNVYLFTFTVIHSIQLLESLVFCVSELAIDALTNKKILSIKERVILTLVKIKQNMSFRAIGVLIGINRQTCSNYFKKMCPILCRVLIVVIPWRDIEMIRSNLPKSFQKYKHTRIILDFSETVIEK